MTINKTEQLIEEFTKNVNNENNYTLKQLQEILKKSFQNIYKSKSSKTPSGEKKPASPYNLFIREQIQILKEAKDPNISAKNYMSIAASKWKEHKESLIIE